MATPSQEAIDTFTAITGASDVVAVAKLEEHRGNLNAAINAHFSEADTVNMRDQSRLDAHQDFMDIDDEVDLNLDMPHLPSLPRFPRLTLPDPPRRLHGGSTRNSDAPLISFPRERREIPIEFKDGSNSGRSVPTIEDVTESVPKYGHPAQGSIIIDDDDHSDSQVRPAAANLRNNDEFNFTHTPSAPPASYLNADADADIEEQMVRAAIEASKQEVSSMPETAFNLVDAAALSLKATDERAMHDKDVQYGWNGGSSSSAAENITEMAEVQKANRRQELGPLNDGASSRSRSDDDEEDPEDQPLMRRRSSRIHNSANAHGQSRNRPSSVSEHPQLNGDVFSDEWGGISSEERDEAVMLEAAMLGVPGSSSYPFSYHSQSLSERDSPFHARVPRSPSPTLVAQRTIRDQQDDEYLASLAADREKDLKAIQEEEAAKQATLEQERRQNEEAQKKLHEEEEYEKQLARKEASLPKEPALDDENVVTILVRLPNGIRRGRRFLKSDKLQCLFDFIDVGRVVKPSTYRLVRQHPSRVFGEGEKDLSLSELGLTSKQEALFLDM